MEAQQVYDRAIDHVKNNLKSQSVFTHELDTRLHLVERDYDRMHSQLDKIEEQINKIAENLGTIKQALARDAGAKTMKTKLFNGLLGCLGLLIALAANDYIMKRFWE
jgi:chromosome segregation ATPase